MAQKRICDCNSCGTSKPKDNPNRFTIFSIKDEKIRAELFTTTLCYLGDEHKNESRLEQLRSIEGRIGRKLPFITPNPRAGYWEASFAGISALYRRKFIDFYPILMDGMINFKECPLRAKGANRLLDFGCNVGATTFWYNEFLGFDAWGVDSDPFAVSLGYFFGSDKLKTLRKSGNRYLLPFADSSFDIVVSSWTLFSIPLDRWELDETITEIARVLSSGGFLVVHPLSGSSDGHMDDYRSIFNPIHCAVCLNPRGKGCDAGLSVWMKV